MASVPSKGSMRGVLSLNVIPPDLLTRGAIIKETWAHPRGVVEIGITGWSNRLNLVNAMLNVDRVSMCRDGS